uniref:endo-1,4-beta-xylanase n=1 Tax=uncultured bacterium contig00029 TaxID=1181518 RepID=A0A806KH36_9BACT|nr:endo-1,4-beta-xylanase A precursor [uncultured bacterium contig00029]
MKKFIIFSLIAVFFAPLFAQNPCSETAKLSEGTQLSMNGNQGMGNLSGTDYHYEAWIEGGNSSDQKLLWYGANQGGGAAFRAEWKNPNDYLGRIGYFWGGSSGPKYSDINNVYVDFNYTRSGNNTAGDYSYIGVYGWARNSSASASSERLIEYYVVEDWFGNQWQNQSEPVGNNTIDGTEISSSFNMDGSTYKIYKKTRTGPSVDGNSTFTQIFSVRQTQRKCGSISVTEHFKEWERIGGIKFNNLYDLKFLVEAGGGTGWFDATYIKLTRNATSNGGNSSNSGGGSSSSNTGGTGSSSSQAVQATTCQTPLITYPTNTVPSNPYTACFMHTNGKCYVCKVENESGNNTCRSSWVWNGSQIESNLESGYWYREVPCPSSTSSSSQASSSSQKSSSSQSSSSSNTSSSSSNKSSSSAGVNNLSSSSSDNGEITPILTQNYQQDIAVVKYYDLQGQALGNVKPKKPGVYIVKNTKTRQIKKEVVK